MPNHEKDARESLEYWTQCVAEDEEFGLFSEARWDQRVVDYWHGVWTYHHAYDRATR
jgi:hypothetical protein